jgi:EpsI family protein
MAEGFLHDFEGWALFMVCTALLVAEAWLFWRFSGDDRPFSAVFGIVLPARHAPGGGRARPLPRSLVAALGVLVMGIVLAPMLENRTEIVPSRTDFGQFAYRQGDWATKRQLQLDSIIANELNSDDYYMADFRRPGYEAPVNLHMTYYESQRARSSVHSPRACLPGGGWGVESVEQRDLDGVKVNGRPLRVNRVLMAKGNDRQLVYYFFPQRHRNLTNEYLVRWYVFTDALTIRRSDGGLVRFITPLSRNEDWDDADRRLSEFAAEVVPRLGRFFPR